MSEGTQEGDVCGAWNEEDGVTCDGSLEYAEVKGCTCHISPPCGACVDNPLTCSVCGREVEP